jgi:DNA-binding response OmpR family regulator/RecA/RadA recombinase
MILADVVLDLPHRVLRRGEQVRALSGTEAAMLAVLAEARGEVVSREALHSRCFAPMTPVRAVDFAIRRLRAKLEADPSAPRLLLTVHGEGYRLVQPAPVPEPPADVPVLVLGERVVELESGAISGGGTLTSLERAVLACLAQTPGRVVSREQLLRRVWRGRSGRESRRPDAVIRGLRLKLEREPSQPVYLRSVSGGGWKLELERRGTNLAPDLTSFVGRQRELQQLRTLLSRHRWVEITGPDGVGKSRLARELVLEQASAGGGGAWWAEGAGTLWERVGLALGVQPALPEAVLAALVARAPLLLGLDDRAPEETELISELLARVAGLRVLATSRTRGPVAARSFRLAPLRPDEARALFFARAEPAGPLDERVLDSLLLRLDHLPLAIELAARRLDVVDLDWLERHLDPLEPVPGVSRSLGSALQSAWEPLEPALQQGLAAATLFLAPFDPAALGSLCDELVHRCWLQSIETPVGRRLRLLETTRRFVQARLAPSPEARRAHAAHFAQQARSLRERLRTAQGPRARLELAHGLDDLKAASLCGPLEVTLAVAELLDLPPAVSPSTLLELVTRWVALHPRSAQLRLLLARRFAWLEQEPKAMEALGEALRLGMAPEAWPVRELRAFLAAEHDESFPELGPSPSDPIGRASWLYHASSVASSLSESEGFALQLMRHAQRQGDTYAERLALAQLAVVAYHEGETAAALSYTERQLEMERKDELLHVLPYTLHQLCLIWLEKGGIEEATAALEEAELLALPLEEPALQTRLYQARARLALEQDDLPAVRRYAAATLQLAGPSRVDVWGACVMQALAAMRRREDAEAREVLARAEASSVKEHHHDLLKALLTFLEFLQTGEPGALPAPSGRRWSDRILQTLQARMAGLPEPDPHPAFLQRVLARIESRSPQAERSG